VFQEATTGTFGKIGELFRKRPEVLSKTDAQAVDLVLTGKFAFIKVRQVEFWLLANGAVICILKAQLYVTYYSWLRTYTFFAIFFSSLAY
jgi:hypothetical protein